MRAISFFLLISLSLSLSTQAASRRRQPAVDLQAYPAIIGYDTVYFKTYTEAWDAQIQDQIKQLAQYDTLPANATFRDTIIYNKLFLPITFKARAIPKNYQIYRVAQYQRQPDLGIQFNLPKNRIEQAIKKDSLMEILQYQVCINNPLLAKYNEQTFASHKTIDTRVYQKNQLSELHVPFDAEMLPSNKRDISIQGLEIKPKKWLFNSALALQLANNYVTPNWYQGGEVNTTLYSNASFKGKYDDFKNVIFELELDWRMGFYNSPKDTVNNFRVNEDQFRLLSKFGYKAFSKWFYSASIEFKTKLFDAFPANSNDQKKRTAAFLSPAEAYIGLGIEYKNSFEKVGIENINIFLSPVTYTWKFRNDVIIPVGGIEKDEHALHDIGSMIRTNLRWKLAYNLYWDTRIYYFTTYKNIEAEWENTIQFALTRFFSAKLFFILRYDDKRKLKPENDSFFQFKEYLSLGFAHRF